MAGRLYQKISENLKLEIPAGEHHPKVSEKFPEAGDTNLETQQGRRSPSVVCQEYDERYVTFGKS